MKGSENDVDMELLNKATIELPNIPRQKGCEQGPKLMLLGPIPAPQSGNTDYGWFSFDFDIDFDIDSPQGSCSGFSMYFKNSRPWFLPCGDVKPGHATLVEPCLCDEPDYSRVGYIAARSARFEHGEHGTILPTVNDVDDLGENSSQCKHCHQDLWRHYSDEPWVHLNGGDPRCNKFDPPRDHDGWLFTRATPSF